MLLPMNGQFRNGGRWNDFFENYLNDYMQILQNEDGCQIVPSQNSVLADYFAGKQEVLELATICGC